MNTDIIPFAESAQEELFSIAEDLRLANLAEHLRSGRLPADVQEDVTSALLTMLDMFSLSMPNIDVADPMGTLRVAARDVTVARVLKERGLFRVYRLLNSDVEELVADPTTGEVTTVMVPAFRKLIDPETDQPFQHRKDLISWFCSRAHVSRATAFARMATASRLIDTLGFSVEDAYQAMITHPYAVREILNMMGTWSRADLVDIRPEVASRLAQKMLPSKAADRVDELVAYMRTPDLDADDQDTAHAELVELIKPAMASLVRTVQNTESVRDVMDFARHDLAGKPEVKYFWDYERDALKVEVSHKAIDPAGTEYIVAITVVHLLADPAMPPEALKDLLERLPVTNHYLPE